MSAPKKLLKKDAIYLKECIRLAQESLDAGDAPFGSVLVDADGQIIARARNRVTEINILSHPELELALWVADNLSPEEAKTTTMYTSGEHCPMCAAAQGWAGVHTLVYLHSGRQLTEWRKELGYINSPVNMIPVEKIIRDIEVRGPGEGALLEKIKVMQLQYIRQTADKR